MKKTYLLVFLAILSPCLLQAQTPKYSNEFMYLGVGARALGMGKAFTAISDDASSGYWNPAGLLHLPSNIQLKFMHSEYMAGLAAFDYGAIGFKTGSQSALGISYIRFGIDDIPDTSELIDAEGNINMDKIRSFSASDNAFLLSYARGLKDREQWRYGFTAKVIRRTAGTFANAWGFGIDAGLQYHSPNLMLALSVRDITTTFNAWSYSLSDAMKEVFTLTGNTIPENSVEITLPRFIAGAAYRFTLPKDFSLLLSTDLIFTTDGKRNVLIPSNFLSIDPALGLEVQYNNMIYLRGGISDYQKATDDFGEKIHSFTPSFGLGIVIRDKLTVDYALVDVGNNAVALYSNVFSIKLNINRKE